jgi:hypothetical protein
MINIVSLLKVEMAAEEEDIENLEAFAKKLVAAIA